MEKRDQEKHQAGSLIIEEQRSTTIFIMAKSVRSFSILFSLSQNLQEQRGNNSSTILMEIRKDKSWKYLEKYYFIKRTRVLNI
jgi:hypothetical protein